MVRYNPQSPVLIGLFEFLRVSVVAVFGISKSKASTRAVEELNEQELVVASRCIQKMLATLLSKKKYAFSETSPFRSCDCGCNIISIQRTSGSILMLLSTPDKRQLLVIKFARLLFLNAAKVEEDKLYSTDSAVATDLFKSSNPAMAI